MFEKLSPKSIKIVMLAQEEARRFLNSFVLPEHILLGLLKENGTSAYKLLNEKGIFYDDIFEKIKNHSDNKPSLIRLEMQFSPITKQAVEMAADEAERLNEPLIQPEHLLLGIVNIGESKVTEILRESGINLSRIRWHLLRLREMNESSQDINDFTEEVTEIPLTSDLSSKVEKREIEAVIERENYIEQIIYHLNLYNKIYPIIIGEDGIGKTSIITGLTQYLMEGKIYKELQNFRVIEFNFKTLFYEAVDNNDVIKKFKELLEVLKNTKDIILVIEDFPNNINFDSTIYFIYSMLIHFIKSNNINIIAVENKDNYEKYFKKQNISKYFTPINVKEPELDENIEILKYKAKLMKKFHDVNIEEPALELLLSSAKSIYPDDFYPNCAVKLLDILLSQKKFSKSIVQSKIKDIEKNLRNLRNKRDEYISKSEFEKIEELKIKAQAYEEQIKILTVNISSSIKPTLTVRDVQLIIREKLNQGEKL